MRRRWIASGVAGLVAALGAPTLATAAEIHGPLGTSPFAKRATHLLAASTNVPSGFDEDEVITGLEWPTAVRFAPDGTVFVAEKAGLIKRYSSIADTSPETVVDVRQAVHGIWDRGLLGLAVDPQYPRDPYVYGIYTYDAPPSLNDACAGDSGTDKGCRVDGRISRFTMGGQETVLTEDFCQQYPSHSIGDLVFGRDGKLYASAGDGASFTFNDYGQRSNPCGDPVDQGGSLRSQRPGSATYDGKLLRVDPDTGAETVVASGLRNPYRLAARPGTDEVWAGDVGEGTWEEVNRFAPGGKSNFGWPCYEGDGRHPAWDGLNKPLCETLYTAAGDPHAKPFYSYKHGDGIAAECSQWSSSISGLDFYDGGTFPAAYTGALFFADYARRCMWVMPRGADGLPDRSRLQLFAKGIATVDVQVGPGGALYHVDHTGGSILRIRATNGNRAPDVRIAASPAEGPTPLSVSFSAAGSSDPDGEPLTYAWDLDLDGDYDDATGLTAARTFEEARSHRVRVRATDPNGLADQAEIVVRAGMPPEASMSAPAATTSWAVGDALPFAGTARGADGTPLPASALTWSLVLHHCPRGECHAHPVQSWSGVHSGTFVAPDHEFPSYLELTLTATHSGLTDTVSRRLDPRSVTLTVASEPTGLEVFGGLEAGAAPLHLDVIEGAATTVGAVTPQDPWSFAGWPEPGPASREVVAREDTTVTATFSRAPQPPPDAGAVLPAPPDAKPRGPVAAWRFPGRARGRAFGSPLERRVALPAAFTVQAWVRRERGGRVVTGLAGKRVAFALGVKAGRTTLRKLRGSAGVRRGRWTHVALSYDGATARLYRGGNLVASRRLTGAGKATRVRVGGLRGRLDDVVLHDRALAAAELRQAATGAASRATIAE